MNRESSDPVKSAGSVQSPDSAEPTYNQVENLVGAEPTQRGEQNSGHGEIERFEGGSGLPRRPKQERRNAKKNVLTSGQEPPVSPFAGQSEGNPSSSLHPHSGRWGILIREEVKGLQLIRPPDPKHDDDRCYKHASYDLRLGAEYILPNVGDGSNQLVIRNCEENGMLTIYPFASAIISTYESVSLPKNVAGRFDLRIDHALEGLMVQMGTQIEPGYEGPLFALVHNLSENKKILKFRDYETRPFTIEFSYTSQPSTPPENKKKNIRDFIPPNYATGGVDRVLGELRTMQDKVKQLSEDINTKKLAFFTGVIILFIIAAISIIVPFVLAKFTYDKDYFPIVNADAVAAMKDESKQASQEAIVNSVIQKLKDKGVSGPVAPVEYSFVNKLVRLKVRRDSIRGDPSRAEELKAIDKEINRTLENLREYLRK